MTAGADVDARTFLLPDTVTAGTLISGIWRRLRSIRSIRERAREAAARAAGTAAVLLLVRWSYARLREREGVGLGDVKLAAGIGAWLPLDAIPVCFGFAASAALVAVLLAHLRGPPCMPPPSCRLVPFSVRRSGWSYASLWGG